MLAAKGFGQGDPVSEATDAMRRALRAIVVPRLRALGFDGAFPHFRRVRDGVHETLMFQFDKYGHGFFLEAGSAAADEFLALQREWEAAGAALPASKFTVAHCAPHRRGRLGGLRAHPGANHRFAFTAGDGEEVARRVADVVDAQVEAHFATAR